MASKRDMTIFAVGIVLVVIGIFYVNNSNSLFYSLTEPLLPVNWDEVIKRDIVKTTFLLTLLEENGDMCVVSLRAFNELITHVYFDRGNELGNELQFNSENSTITVPCEQLGEEKSKLEVWFAVPEASSHATKYEYWITPWE